MPRLRIRGPNGMTTWQYGDEATVADLLSQIKANTGLGKFDIKYGYPPKPLSLESSAALLSSLGVPLNGEQLIISNTDDSPPVSSSVSRIRIVTWPEIKMTSPDPRLKWLTSWKNTKDTSASSSNNKKEVSLDRPIGLKRKELMDTPELAMPGRGSTLGMLRLHFDSSGMITNQFVVLRVMPDDNSCLFRAFGLAVVPTDDLTMPELRSLVASAIQDDPLTYSEVVLEKKPDDYCRWIQNP